MKKLDRETAIRILDACATAAGGAGEPWNKICRLHTGEDASPTFADVIIASGADTTGLPHDLVGHTSDYPIEAPSGRLYKLGRDDERARMLAALRGGRPCVPTVDERTDVQRLTDAWWLLADLSRTFRAEHGRAWVRQQRLGVLLDWLGATIMEPDTDPIDRCDRKLLDAATALAELESWRRMSNRALGRPAGHRSADREMERAQVLARATGGLLPRLIEQVHRLRSMAGSPGMAHGVEPHEVIEALRSEVFEVESEDVGSHCAQREAAGCMAVATHLAIAQGGDPMVLLAEEIDRLKFRNDHVASGRTWAEAKVIEREGIVIRFDALRDPRPGYIDTLVLLGEPDGPASEAKGGEAYGWYHDGIAGTTELVRYTCEPVPLDEWTKAPEHGESIIDGWRWVAVDGPEGPAWAASRDNGDHVWCDGSASGTGDHTWHVAFLVLWQNEHGAPPVHVPKRRDELQS